MNIVNYYTKADEVCNGAVYNVLTFKAIFY